jgi:hypothetical protein
MTKNTANGCKAEQAMAENEVPDPPGAGAVPNGERPVFDDIEEEHRQEHALAAMERPPKLSASMNAFLARVRAWIRVSRGMIALRKRGACEHMPEVIAALDREALLLRIQVYLRGSRSTVPLAYADVCECRDEQLRELAALLASLQREGLKPV